MSTDSSPASSAGATYSLAFVNNSSQTGTACVYQNDPTMGVPNAMSLAWMTRVAAPRTKLVFQWQVDYSFVWAETGALVPGVMFEASQTWPADLSTANQVTLSYMDGFYTFENQTQGPRSGSLYIVNGPSVPAGDAAVGIGMSGLPIYAVQAQPNWNLVFTPHPLYWITFGNYVQGEVMDVESISNAAQVIFPPGGYSMTATLNQNMSWTIQQNH